MGGPLSRVLELDGGPAAALQTADVSLLFRRAPSETAPARRPARAISACDSDERSERQSARTQFPLGETDRDCGLRAGGPGQEHRHALLSRHRGLLPTLRAAGGDTVGTGTYPLPTLPAVDRSRPRAARAGRRAWHQ